MTLEYVSNSTPWTGEAINGVKHPRDIEQKWTAEELAAIGLRVRPPPAPTAQDVVAERDRRLALGFDYDFEDERGIHSIGTTKEDWVGWNEVINLANALIDSGQGSTTIDIITNTGPITVTALEWQAIMLAGAASRQTVWARSFSLQSKSPIPEDYQSDYHWE